MKTKLLIVLAIMGLVLAVTGTTKAIDLREGPIIFKTWNYEVGTSYSGGLEGKFYFRTSASSYWTEEHGLVTYSASNPNHRLFTGNSNPADDLIITKAPSLEADEDSFGLLRIAHIFEGDVTLGDSRFGDGSDATQVGNDITAFIEYWNEIVDDKSLLGMFWGNQDQVVEVVDSSDNEYRIWSSGGQFDLFEVDGPVPYNPAVNAAYSPAARTDTDDFNVNWFDRNSDRLVIGGILDYFRFQGNATSLTNFDGETETLLTFTRGDWAGLFQAWWTAPDGASADMWQSWNIGDPFVYSNGWTGSEDSARGYIGSQELLECRVTGGGVDEFTGLWDGTLAEAKSNNPNGPIDSYRFGGQAGAPTGCQPQPWGEWTHHQQSGPDGSFVFHAGTASAPPGTEIDWIECADPGWCVQARPAPAKQINFTGVGTFKNMKKPSARLSNVVVGKTFHWFEVHIEDLGEPGKGGKVDPPAPQCSPEGSEGELADCGCPDFYRITIYEAFYPPAEPNKTTIIYEVYGYIRGGNLQIHPSLPCK